MLFVICILCAALALWLAATLFLWHRELLEIQKALEDIGAGNLNRRIVTRGPQQYRRRTVACRGRQHEKRAHESGSDYQRLP